VCTQRRRIADRVRALPPKLVLWLSKACELFARMWWAIRSEKMDDGGLVNGKLPLYAYLEAGLIVFLARRISYFVNSPCRLRALRPPLVIICLISYVDLERVYYLG
jgi:hypothetical protein